MTLQFPYWVIGWRDSVLRRSSLREGSIGSHEFTELGDHKTPGGWWIWKVKERDCVNPLSRCSLSYHVASTVQGPVKAPALTGDPEENSSGSLKDCRVYKGSWPVSPTTSYPRHVLREEQEEVMAISPVWGMIKEGFVLVIERIWEVSLKGTEGIHRQTVQQRAFQAERTAVTKTYKCIRTYIPIACM